MKLPLDGEAGQSEGQAEPSTREREHENGHDDRVGDSAGVQTNGQAAANGSSAAPQDPDFSEYMWMEHEEEFDEQVLRELEDEEMINYYFELYEQSVEDEARKRNHTANSHHNPHPRQAERRDPPNAAPGCTFRIPQATPPFIGGYPPFRNQEEVDEITTGLDRVNFTSRLNPNAAEFVPRGQSSMNPNADSDHRPPPDTQPC